MVGFLLIWQLVLVESGDSRPTDCQNQPTAKIIGNKLLLIPRTVFDEAGTLRPAIRASGGASGCFLEVITNKGRRKALGRKLLRRSVVRLFQIVAEARPGGPSTVPCSSMSLGNGHILDSPTALSRLLHRPNDRRQTSRNAHWWEETVAWVAVASQEVSAVTSEAAVDSPEPGLVATRV